MSPPQEPELVVCMCLYAGRLEQTLLLIDRVSVSLYLTLSSSRTKHGMLLCTYFDMVYISVVPDLTIWA